jgi:hypothetical protein
MHFPYGISRASLLRWECYLRIAAVQAERGPEVGTVAMSRIVDAELDAIMRATLACAEWENEIRETRRF